MNPDPISPHDRSGTMDFQAFFESSGVGNVLVDARTGCFLTVNGTFCELTGYSRSELAGMSAADLTHPEDRLRDTEGWEESLAHGDGPYTIEKRYLRKDGAEIWVSVISTVIRDERQVPCYATGVIMDVTASRRNVAGVTPRVVERTRAFETLIEAAPVAVIALDRARRVEVWNPQAEHLFGLREEEARGRSLLDLPLKWQSPDLVDALLDQPSNDHAALTVEVPSARVLEVSVWCAPHSSPDGAQDGRVLLVLDETEKKFLEHALLDAGEREQRRIGQELHEGLCQHLLGAAFGAQALFKNLDRTASPSAELAADLARLINESVVQARNLARGINPVEMDSAGLMSALHELAERTRIGEARVELRCDRPVLVKSTATALHVFRIAQDALTTALRHARATRILICLAEDDERVTLQVSDNGRRLEASADAGLIPGIMKYRAQAIRGDLTVETAADEGTTLICTFPNH